MKLSTFFTVLVLAMSAEAQAASIDTTRLNQCVQDKKEVFGGVAKPFTVSAIVECPNLAGTDGVVTAQDKANGKFYADRIPFRASKKLRYAAQSGRHIVGDVQLQEKTKTNGGDIAELQYEYAPEGYIKAVETTLSCVSPQELCLLHCDQVQPAVVEYSIAGETQRNYSEDQVILWSAECAISQVKNGK